MASSGKSKRSKRRDLAAHVAAHLKAVVAPGSRVVLGLSGGVDSVVLLDVLAHLARRMSFELRALHVNHQLSPNAAAWARFCRELSRERGIACTVRRVAVERGNSTERAAREARYAALRSARADVIALAHNADDQAETVLLQLLRGAGVKGLSAMPIVNRARPPVVRPLLHITRAEIEAYARRGKLEWIEDESNLSGAYLRNWLRHEIAPRIAERVPAYRSILTRAARRFAETGELLEELARIDGAGEALSAARLKTMSAARARNVLRHALAEHGYRMPEAERLNEALRQALTARSDARIEVDLGECTLRRRGDVLHLTPAHNAVAADLRVTWNGESQIAVAALDGVLAMRRTRGAGLSLARLQSEPVTIRRREGGEKLQPASNRPTRTVKNLLQEADVPAWDRERLPFIYSGDALACIPGVAVDHRFQAGPGEASIDPLWRPAGARRVSRTRA
jgi:tRNA(Ile)-lysidine synthase